MKTLMGGIVFSQQPTDQGIFPKIEQLSESGFTGLKDVQDKLVFHNPNDLKIKNPEGMKGL